MQKWIQSAYGQNKNHGRNECESFHGSTYNLSWAIRAPTLDVFTFDLRVAGTERRGELLEPDFITKSVQKPQQMRGFGGSEINMYGPKCLYENCKIVHYSLVPAKFCRLPIP